MSSSPHMLGAVLDGSLVMESPPAAGEKSPEGMPSREYRSPDKISLSDKKFVYFNIKRSLFFAKIGA